MLEIAGMACMALGALFFVAGTIGLLRFPDVFCRLHALTKADGMGLALVCLGAAIGAPDGGEALRILLIWIFVALASATGGHLVARHARRAGKLVREVRP
ncbi:monovalent cation/H(+) antiporter subunit G [Rhodovulum euryhalinum]|uniref:Multisubunit sodium/proton antiporter MrpG subunit n=1 Tax=Rhodovulum euryhalinum TaxID=35805 RepID=A0A4R2KKS5_9RHOB|nr:monovalent cation/H(+) antiporter subunit G [Rhodovulum euryhalinum]TCO74273.1 multisubunit sodium/proton antiporter MrpG subunit [Rhodovulum euryhalinum]